MNEDGGPAFPARIPLVHSEEQGKDYTSYDEAGMSLRDYFACHALQGLLAAQAHPDPNGAPTLRQHTVDYSSMAYILADAMIAEREKS